MDLAQRPPSADLETILAVLHALAGAGAAAATSVGGCGGLVGGLFQPVKVQVADGREFFALLGPERSSAGLRLLADRGLLGCKARIGLLRPEGGRLDFWAVRVLWTVRLRDGLFENGAAFVERSAGCPRPAPRAAPLRQHRER
jgi:hypothetical protein